MTEEEYRKMAEEAGYTEEEIQDLIDFHNSTDIPFDLMPLFEKIVD